MWQGCTKWKAVSFIQNLLYQKRFYSYLPYKISKTKDISFIFALQNLSKQLCFIHFCFIKSLESRSPRLHDSISWLPSASTPFFANPSSTPGTHNSDYILGLRLRSLLTVKYKDVSPTSWPGLPNLLQVRVPHVVYREQEYVLVFITACLDLKTSQNVVLCLQNCLDT